MKFIQKRHPESYQTDFGMILDVILYEVHTYDFTVIIMHYFSVRHLVNMLVQQVNNSDD